jgi:hypothetical protein
MKKISNVTHFLITQYLKDLLNKWTCVQFTNVLRQGSFLRHSKKVLKHLSFYLNLKYVGWPENQIKTGCRIVFRRKKNRLQIAFLSSNFFFLLENAIRLLGWNREQKYKTEKFFFVFVELCCRVKWPPPLS